ncbi:hypothetical protein AMECASPLE_024498, partial [Ameca splendens]
MSWLKVWRQDQNAEQVEEAAWNSKDKEGTNKLVGRKSRRTNKQERSKDLTNSKTSTRVPTSCASVSAQRESVRYQELQFIMDSLYENFCQLYKQQNSSPGMSLVSMGYLRTFCQTESN